MWHLLLVTNLATLAPMLKHFGGQAVLGDLLSAIQDVSVWWP